MGDPFVIIIALDEGTQLWQIIWKKITLEIVIADKNNKMPIHDAYAYFKPQIITKHQFRGNFNSFILSRLSCKEV